MRGWKCSDPFLHACQPLNAPTRAITVLQLSKARIGSFLTPLISLEIIFQSHFWVLTALLKIQTIFMLFPAKRRQGKLYMSNEGTAQKLRKKGFWSHQHALQTCEGKDSQVHPPIGSFCPSFSPSHS